MAGLPHGGFSGILINASILVQSDKIPVVLTRPLKLATNLWELNNLLINVMREMGGKEARDRAEL